MRAIIGVAVALVLLSTPAWTQTSRYSSWSNPDQQGSAGGDLAGFLERLNKLIDEAEKAKAADPVFLRDLRDLASGYTRPWNTSVLSDSFADGDFTANPKWQVLSGEYFIEQGWGLRNKLLQQQQTSSSSQSNTQQDLAVALLGQILNQATGNKNTGAEPAPSVTENVIATSVKLSNAFALETEVSSWVAGGRLEIGVFQGSDAKAGYRLVYEGGQKMRLVRVGSRGISVIEASADALALEDKKFHKIEWTRGLDGVMRVSVDGTQVISVTDKSFNDPFDGVRISDTGGDFIVKRIAASGV